jgi:phosphopantothenoylcysteine decarboxylase
MNILLGVTGSVAAVLTPKLIDSLKELGDVKVIFTDTTYNFIHSHEVHHQIYNDRSEWSEFDKVGDPILHIELRKWADVMVIAPCTMNTLAKISNGLCDNLLTNVVRAWDWGKPMIIAPACNTYMWDNPITHRQIETMKDMGTKIVPPVNKTLACGDTGIGAMAPIKSIRQFVQIWTDQL